MTSTPPPHYVAFRLFLVAVIAATLLGAAWWFTDPAALADLVDLLGLG
jgi:hypothetical protein